MGGAYTRDKIENWVSDFCVSDAMRQFSPGVRDIAGDVLVHFLAAACEVREVEPEEIEEGDVKEAMTGTVARLSIEEGVRPEIPGLCGDFLGELEGQGRLSGGRLLGAFAKALAGSYLEAASPKVKPIVRPGSKIGRNDPCPCGSGKKYKKCCQQE